MRPTRNIKHLAAAAALTGAALAATPGLAHAAPSTCQYNTSNKNLIINDRSGTAPLKIFRTPAGEIRYSDGTNSPGFACFVPNTPNTATITNTDRIAVLADLVRADSDVISGTYTCTRCGFKLHFASTEQLPPCIACGNGEWRTVTGGSTSDALRPERSPDTSGPRAGR